MRWTARSAQASRAEIGSHTTLIGHDSATIHDFVRWFSDWLDGSESLNQISKTLNQPGLQIRLLRVFIQCKDLLNQGASFSGKVDWPPARFCFALPNTFSL